MADDRRRDRRERGSRLTGSASARVGLRRSRLQLVGRVDRLALFLNLLLMMSIVAIPFTTGLLSEYLLTGGGNARTAALVYSLVMVAMAVSFSALFLHVARHPALLAEGVDPAGVHWSIVRFSLVGLALYLVTVVVALISAPACLIAHFLLALYYCFQQIRPGAARA